MPECGPQPSCRVFSGLRLQAVMSVSRGSGKRPWGPLPIFFRMLRAQERAARPPPAGCRRIPSGGAAAPGEGPALAAGALPGEASSALPVARAGRMADLRSEPLKAQESAFTPVSPVIPGWDSSQPQKPCQVTYTEDAVLPVGLHPRPAFSWGPTLAPCPQPAGLGPDAPLREAFPPVCLVDSPHLLQGPCVARCAEPSWRIAWNGPSPVLSPAALPALVSLPPVQLSAPGGRFVPLGLF